MYKRKKHEIMEKIEDIDKKCEAYGMTILERKERGDLEEELKKVVREDRLKWMQRCKEKNLLEGDDNTKYYHAKANGRKRKNMIYSLDQEEGEIKGQSDLMKYITNFYKQLFGPPPENDFTLNLEGIAMLSEAEKERLIRPIEMEELKKVFFGMENNKAPGPDGFPVEFYKHFWNLIKDNLMELITDFMKRKIGVERLNYGVITLIPKCKEARMIQKFRPICLLNVSFKIITKILMERLAEVIEVLIALNQTAFIKNRYIMEGVVTMHEILNSIHQKKQAGILFKIDFEKAYDNIKWSFVYKMMKAKGFPDKWCDWILKVVKGGKVAIRVNDQIGHYFTTHKGLRQGDPLSPLLFNIAADALTILIKRAEQQGLIKGLGMDVMREGVAILQYADDTICLIQDSLEYAKNLKFILCIFEQLTGLKVNFHKSEVFCLGEAAERQDSYSQMFTCQIGRLPMKYLGVPIDQVRIHNKDWKPVEEKIEKKLGCWQGKLLAIGGRVALINSSISSVPLYMMSLYSLPCGVREKIDFYRRRFLWQEDQGIRKYHLVKWPVICLPKDQGGLGILDLDVMNKALLGK